MAARPIPASHASHRNMAAIRAAAGPGFQTGATERLLQQAVSFRG